MPKLIVALLTILLLNNLARATPTDSLITISSLKINCRFVYNSKEKNIEVKQTETTNYLSGGYQLTFPVSEVYDNNVVFDNVSCKIDDHNAKNFEPRYAYYSVDDYFFSDEHVCYFPVTLPKIGSRGEVTFKETITDPRYFTSLYFNSRYAAKNVEISLNIPRWMKVDIKELNFDNLNIQKKTSYDAVTDEDIITYTAQNIPAGHREENSPGPTYMYPHLFIMCKTAATAGNTFTYFDKLSDQYAWYHQLTKSLINNDDVLTAKAKELTAGLSNDIDKIKAIFYYVQDNIRYIAFEDGLAGFKPENAGEVLRKKYGDCKGMANLTKCLLTALGYDARLCWLGTNYIAYDYSTPSMGVDNHMICGLSYQGKMFFLDATEKYLGMTEHAERIQGRQVLMEDGDKFILTRVPVVQTDQNADNEISKLSIVNGVLTGNVNRMWRGESKESTLAGLNGIKKDDAETATVRYLSNDNSNYIIHDLKLSSTTDPDKDLSATYTVEDKASISTFNKEYYLDIDLKKEFMTAAIKIADRKNDYWFDNKVALLRETDVAIPAGYKISSLPANLDINNDDYEFHIKYSNSAGSLTYQKNILIKNTHLPKAKFEQWNKDIDLLTKAYNESIIIKSE